MMYSFIILLLLCVCAAIAKLSSFVPSNYFAQLVKDKARVVFTGKSCLYHSYVYTYEVLQILIIPSIVLMVCLQATPSEAP